MENVLQGPMNWIQFGISSLIFIISGIAAVLKVGWDLAQHEKKLEVSIDRVKNELKADYLERIHQLDEQREIKMNRVYQRFDDFKTLTENAFVRRDMCSVMHQTNSVSVNALTQRIELLEKKIDDLRSVILKFNGGQK